MRILFLTTFLALALLSLVPLSADAQAYQPLAPIPGVSSGISFSQFVERIVVIALSIGAILAVLMLVVGGFEWMVSEAVHKKELGRERVRNAIFGLLILLAAVLVLNTINPQLINLNPAVQELKLPLVERPSDTSKPDCQRLSRFDCQSKWSSFCKAQGQILSYEVIGGVYSCVPDPDREEKEKLKKEQAAKLEEEQVAKLEEQRKIFYAPDAHCLTSQGKSFCFETKKDCEVYVGISDPKRAPVPHPCYKASDSATSPY